MESETSTVALAGGQSATAHLHRTLHDASRAHPDVFADVDIGDSAEGFKKRYPELLPDFEAARADSTERAAIARQLVASARGAVVWRTDSGEQPLGEHVGSPVEPFEIASVRGIGNGRLRPRVPFGGREVEADDLVAEVQALVDRGSASKPVADAVAWVVERAGSDGIDLRGRRIAVLGAGAELAPTHLWLEGGADVLWIDVAEPPVDLLEPDAMAGSVHWVPGGADLLTEPRRIRATIEAFAGDDAIDLGLYAYAPGRAREWRLAAAMNAIVDELPRELVHGVAMLLSPTTCGVLSPDDLAGEARRLDERPRWQSVAAGCGLLGRGGGHVERGSTCTNRGIVSIQGGSYQAAQYLGKLIAAEAWATADAPIAVSANTAGVSMTDSLQHPVFDTAFSGAAALEVETFEPSTTAHLNGLLTLRDRLEPGAIDGPNEIFATRVHGGVYELPYAIEPALRVATAIGVAKRPSRIGSLLRRS